MIIISTRLSYAADNRPHRGIGCGKTSVSKRFSELGVCVIDTDQISHQMTQRGVPPLAKSDEILVIPLSRKRGP